MNIFGLTLTNMALIAGALGLFVPYLVHLLTRKTPRRIVFPSVRFIKKAEASQSAIFKLRHLIMLLVRTAFVCLLLFAFLKPVFQPHALVAAGTEEGTRAVIILVDNSASMGFSAEGFTPMARARTAAEAIVDSLRPGDACNVIFAGSQPQSSLDAPSDNRFHLKRDIAAAKATLYRANIDAALAEAVRQLSENTAPLKEIHLISDFQRSNWAAVDFTAIPGTCNVVFVPVTAEDAVNVAITEVNVYPPIPAASEEVEITCKIANYTPSQQDLTVQLTFAGSAALEKALSLQPNFSGSATFRVRAERSGRFEGVASIPSHGLTADDQRQFTINVTDRLHVAVLSSVPPATSDSSSRFLMRAVDPYAGAGDTPGAFYASYYDANTLANLPTEQPQVLIIDRPSAFSSVDATAIMRYIETGGAVIYFLSDAIDKANLQFLQSASAGQLLMPFTIADVQTYGDNAADAGFASIGAVNFDEPMLRKFRDSGDLANIQIYRHFATESAGGGAASLMRFSDGNVAMARASFGTGMILLCNFSPGLDFSDLAKRAVFVPLLHEMMKGARGNDAAARSFNVGDAASTTVQLAESAAGVSFTDPAGEMVNAGFERNGGDVAVIFPPTTLTGFYRVHANGTQVGSVAVNLDERESNLESLTMDQLEQLSRIAKDRFFAAADSDPQSLREFTQGRPVWHYFMLAALAALALEQGLLLLLRR